MSILARLWRAIVFARTYDTAFWTLERLSDRQLAAYGVARADIWRAADRVAREAARRAERWLPRRDQVPGAFDLNTDERNAPCIP